MSARAIDARLLEAPLQAWLPAAWRYQLWIPRGFRAIPGAANGPSGPWPALLARYEDGCDRLEVHAAHVVREVDARDFLRCVALPPGVGARGVHGRPAHAEARFSQGSADGCTRCIKAGDRMFVVTAIASGERFRHELVPALDSFAPQLPPRQKHAEPMQWIEGKGPRPHRLALPASWLVDHGGGSIRAENLRAGDEAVVGTLAFGLLPRDAGKTARELASRYLESLRAQGLELGTTSLAALPARRPLKHRWSLAVACSRGARHELHGEVRCQVGLADDFWLLAGVLGESERGDRAAWMQNKRALDVAVSSLKVLP